MIALMVRGTPFERQVTIAVASALVEDMADGGMGSLRFCSSVPGKRLFGRQIGEASFLDEDGIPVSATLNLDQNGALFELDLWKVDNSRLRRIPAAEQVNLVGREG